MPADLIETLLIDAQGDIPQLSRHLERLQASCTALDYVWPGDDEIESALAVAAAGLTMQGPHRLRLLLDRTGHHTIETAPLTAMPENPQLMLSDQALDADEPLLRYKTTHRPWYADATTWLASHPEVFDLLFLNQHGELCEGSRSNVYLHVRGVWYTPPTSSGCLPGVQRADLLERGQVHARALTLKDLHDAQGVRLSNALRGWFDVTLRAA